MFFLPPEWEKQLAIILTWPHANTLWGQYLDEMDKVYIQIVKHIVPREKLIIICFDQTHFRHIEYLLEKAKLPIININFYTIKTNDIWVRDYGPLTIFDTETGQAKLLDFKFNAWGEKYPGDQDDAATKALYQLKAFNNLSLESSDLVLEGGSVEVDGKGTLLTTSSCLLAKTRNPSLNREQLTEKLKLLLGLKKILWLDHGRLEGDDTDGHIDTLARFTDPHTICHISCDDPNDTHFSEIQNMIEQLKSFEDYQGNPYRLIALPWPRPHFKENGQRLPASYANFLIINGAVLMPTYDDPADLIAIKQLQVCFPDREIIGIPCSTVINNYGSLHCITMQIPAK